MRKIKLFGVVAIVTIIGLASCGKYEEGPAVSFRSKKARIEGDWKLVKQIVDGKEETLDADDKDDVFKFNKDGTYELTDPGNGTEKGKWTFNDGKESLTITESSSGFAIVAKILKLKNNEMWLEFDFFGSKSTQHYEQ